jgi:hypothetical protein
MDILDVFFETILGNIITYIDEKYGRFWAWIFSIVVFLLIISLLIILVYVIL